MNRKLYKLVRDDEIDIFNNIENIDNIKKINQKNIILACGGDGTLLEGFNRNKFNDIIFPIRNSHRCELHQDVQQLLNNIDNTRYSEHNILQCNINNCLLQGISEITIRNRDLTQAVRFNVYINDKIYANNVIGDGLIICSSLGSTGYFKSVSNTIFKNGIGIGFINSTQHINHLIVDINDQISFELLRGNVDIAYDKFSCIHCLKQGDIINISSDGIQVLLGYDIFMCQNCRNLRHSALVNDIYNVVN